MFKPVVKNTLYREVVDQLLDEIKKGTWGPGEKFPGEMELSSQFEVGRNSIREALKALQLMGLIESYPGRGTFVTKEASRKIQNTELVSLLSDDNTSYIDLLEVRMGIEVQAAALAAERIDLNGAAKLEESLNKLKEKMTTNQDYSIEGFNFHMCIAELSQNPFMIKFFQTIADELMAQRNPQFQNKIDKKRSLNDHTNIYKAIKANKPAKARDAMYEHFAHAMDDLKQTQNILLENENASNQE